MFRNALLVAFTFLCEETFRIQFSSGLFRFLQLLEEVQNTMSL